MRLLFVKDSLVWPRSSGHDVHTFYMMKACAANGNNVALATVNPTAAEAVAGVALEKQYLLHDAPPIAVRSSWLQSRFRSFWGVSEARIAALVRAVDDFRPNSVIVVGLDALPYFPALSGVTRVWYAADEWVWHHLSQIRIGSPTLRENIKAAAIKGLYERAHSRVVDRAWVVSNSERRAMRYLAGMKHVDVVPNGVDSDDFAPSSNRPLERTAIFWGRLDFGPNIQALQWFARRVWPIVKSRNRDARFTIVGFNPTEPIQRLGSIQGVSIVSNVPDLRPLVAEHAVVVLPFVSGGGIKNKLLEAAAMGKAMVCSPRACGGLRGITGREMFVAQTPDDWIEKLETLWTNSDVRLSLEGAAREWVVANHDWREVAREAVAILARNDAGMPSKRSDREHAA